MRSFSTKSLQLVMQKTSIPTVYTLKELDPIISFSKTGKVSKSLFGSTMKYIPPSEFGYKLPNDGAPEFAFVGRSNVGKSSLVDCLLGNHKIVKISKEPGCTKSINYFAALKTRDGSNHLAYFVDLPGYGFAKTSKDEQVKWSKIIQSYLTTRDQTVLR